MLNRTQAPSFNTIDAIHLLQPEKQVLPNGTPLFVLNVGKEPLVKIEWIFEHKQWSQAAPLLTAACNAMLLNGTTKHSSAEIADFVDFYGAFLQTESSFDQSSVTLYCLSKNLTVVLPLVKEILVAATFPEKELITYQKTQQQKLQVNMQKNDFLARKTFNEQLFGADTAYGCFVQSQHYDALTRTDLLKAYQQIYTANNCTIIASGLLTDDAVKLVTTTFGETDWLGEEVPLMLQLPQSANEKCKLVHREDALQSAIRIGKLSIDKKHPDYVGMRVLNTVLGGYFGSRLMSNIREEKGYTYGIGSNILSMQHASYFYISTEVGAEVCAAAIKEIYKEIKQLREEPIPAQELELVRNYMLGMLLGDLENAFSYADKFKGIYFSGLDYTYYDNLVHTIKTITPKQLQELANTHLQENSFFEVVVGKN